MREKDGRVRRCQLTAAPLQAAAAWIEQYRAFWEPQLESLAEYLEQVQNEEGIEEQGVSGEDG